MTGVKTANMPGARRLRLGLVLFSALLLVIAGRLVWVQVIEGPAIAAEGLKKRTTTQALPATRGEILDANGIVLARSILNYEIVADPSISTKADSFDIHQPDNSVRHVTAEEGIAELSGILGMEAAKVKAALTGPGRFAYVARSIAPEVEERVMNLGFPGISSQAVQNRVYPLGAVGGNVVGYVNDQMHGTGGAEQTLDDELTGTPGSRRFEMGADGVLIPQAPIDLSKPSDGKNVRLTIDSNLQFQAQNAISASVAQLHAEWGSLIVVESKTGKIRAMADTNPMDPNNPGASKPEDRGIRSITAALEPGSTEKAVTAAGALEQNKVQPLTQMVVPPVLSIDGQGIHDSFDHGTLHMTFAGVLGYSLNTGSVMAGSELTRQERYDWLTKFGVGRQTGIQLPGESGGILATPDKWDGRQQYTVLFGQGVAQTPLQTTMIYQAIANGGVRLKPRIVEPATAADGKSAPQADPGTRVVSPETDQKLKDILESVVTAGEVQDVKVPGYRVGGKTGTAETAATDGSGLHGYTASFVGMAPMEDPKYVALVLVQHPQGNIYGISQAPVFNSVMAATLNAYNVAPSTTAPVKLAQKY
ncbi:peptidoglycan D,D-transpeptidase FtsI family protein [Sinomonas sp. G460-2]|uniref:peptidoglycan D,D-transpeptidase FtsI family protein n=1 Tax=Sinomonas sp. G460-2 TaxID=3393464 RepID=UPI0039EEBB8C